MHHALQRLSSANDTTALHRTHNRRSEEPEMDKTTTQSKHGAIRNLDTGGRSSDGSTGLSSGWKSDRSSAAPASKERGQQMAVRG
eukprot:3647415-Amphidinium_carterae.2